MQSLNQHLFKVVPKANIDKLFLKYCIEFNLPELSNSSHGSTMRHITRRELARYELELPKEKSEQSWIANILSTVDYLIDKTEVLIAKYKRIKTGMMHELITRGIDKHGQLRHPSAHKFVESPLGLIPKEWNAVELQSLVEYSKPICYGILQPGHYCEGEVPTLAIKNLGGNYHDGIHLVLPSIDEQYSRSRVITGDLLISVKGTTGVTDIIPEGFEGNIGRDIARIRLKQGNNPYFYKSFFQSPRGAVAVDLITVGTTRKEISIAPLRKLFVPTMSEDEQNSIANQIESLNNYIEDFNDLLNKWKRL